MPKYLNLANSKVLSIDIETYDPNLLTLGTGVYRQDGYILGVAIANEDGFSEYYNLGHYDCTPEERSNNIMYLREVLSLPIQKLGTNLLYDIDWLENWTGSPGHSFRGEPVRLQVAGDLIDIQFAQPLLNENQKSYSLDVLAYQYLGTKKDTTEIDEFCKRNGLEGDSRKWLYKMPYALVQKYAKGDVELPIRIYREQYKLLREEHLMNVFRMECDLIRPNLQMRKNGVLIDNKNREKLIKTIESDISQSYKIVSSYGDVNPNSSQQVFAKMVELGIPVQHTVQFEDIQGLMGKPFAVSDADSCIQAYHQEGYTCVKKSPCVQSPYLEQIMDTHEFARSVYLIRKGSKLVSTFLNGGMSRNVTPDGLLHCSFHPLRNDAYGTRSGRFSSAQPNLQNIPADKGKLPWAKACRKLFLPFEGCMWGKIDYSQVEYRFLAHYAIGNGSDKLRQSYIDDPNTDYHSYVMELTGLDRKYAKNLNFGCAYGMGKRGMMTTFGWAKAFTEHVHTTYHERAPYVRATLDAVGNKAKNRGYIRTILGRRSRLIDQGKSYIMFNRLLQGSAADLMKKALLDCWKSGVMDELHFHLTVHDELDMSVPYGKEDAFRETKDIMEKAMKLKVPIIAESEIGDNWGSTEVV